MDQAKINEASAAGQEGRMIDGIDSSQRRTGRESPWVTCVAFSEVREALELEQRAALTGAISGQEILRRRIVDMKDLEGASPLASHLGIPVHTAAEFVDAAEAAGPE